MTRLPIPLVIMLALSIAAVDARAQDGADTAPAAALDAVGDGAVAPANGAASDAQPTSRPVDGAPAVVPPAPVPPETPPPREPSIGERIKNLFSDPTLGAAMRAIVALFLFLFGWLIARLISRGVLTLTRRLLADPRVVDMLGLSAFTAPPPVPAVEGEEPPAPPPKIDENVA